jgi:hypothetical protein
MVTVSERATARLLEQKHAANLDGEADGLRVAAGPSGQWDTGRRSSARRRSDL